MSQQHVQQQQQQSEPEPIILRVRRSSCRRRGAITSSTLLLEQQQQLLRLELAAAASDDGLDVDDNEFDYNDTAKDPSITRYLTQHQEEEKLYELDDSGCVDATMLNSWQQQQRRKVSLLSRSSITSTTVATVSNGTTASTTTTPSVATTTALFRRMDSLSPQDTALLTGTNGTNSNNNTMKRPRIIDAELIIQTDSHDDYNENGIITKRPRLTLQIISCCDSTSNKYPVLTPEQRMIDDSLQQVFIGTVTLQQHLLLVNEIMINRRNSTRDTGNNSDGTTTTTKTTTSATSWWWPFTWCHIDYGNWIHAAALWNEAILVQETIQQQQQQQSISISSSALSAQHKEQPFTTIAMKMLQTRNKEGLLPMDVAKLSKNYEVQSILQHYIDLFVQEEISHDNPDRNNSNHPLETEGEWADNDDDQYDLYGLVVPMKNDNFSSHHEADDNAITVATCELHNTCRGYWDERGNLILQSTLTDTNNFASSPDGPTNYDDIVGGNVYHQNYLNSTNTNDDDVDSNDEEWDGNDYPDECDDNDDDDIDEDKFGDSDDDDPRHFASNTSRQHRQRYNTINDSDYCFNYDDDDDIDAAHYDPSYGDIYGQSNSLFN